MNNSNLNKILPTCQFVSQNAKHVQINYSKIDTIKEQLLNFHQEHYLTKVPYPLFEMPTQDFINFLLIYNSLDFSFWGNPKWTITANDKNIDGSIALLHCLFEVFSNRDSKYVYQELESMSLTDFSQILEGNIPIPLLEERYQIITSITKIVNEKMQSNFYNHIKNITTDTELFSTILNYFPCFEDTRTYQNQTIYFYKLAQLLTSNILQVLKIKEQKQTITSNLIGCADYKIPQVMQSLNILEYDEQLLKILENKQEIPENSSYEVEIRANMLVVIDYLWQKLNKNITRMEINNFIWSLGQDKNRDYKPYHLTRTKSY